MKSFDQQVRNYVAESGQSLAAVASLLEVSSSEILSWWSGRGSIPTHANIQAMKIALGHHANSRKYTFDNLPKKYSLHAYSSVASSRHILAIIKLQHGSRVLQSVCSKLGVHELYFQEEKNKINIKFFEDLLDLYIKLGNSSNELNALSRGLFLSVEESSIKEGFSITKSYEEAYSQIANSTQSFESNFDYKFFISKAGVDIYSKPSDRLADSVGSARYGSELLYRYRSGLFGNMPILCGLNQLPLHVKSCISRGDEHCHYAGSFADANRSRPTPLLRLV